MKSGNTAEFLYFKHLKDNGHESLPKFRAAWHHFHKCSFTLFELAHIIAGVSGHLKALSRSNKPLQRHEAARLTEIVNEYMPEFESQVMRCLNGESPSNATALDHSFILKNTSRSIIDFSDELIVALGGAQYGDMMRGDADANMGVGFGRSMAELGVHPGDEMVKGWIEWLRQDHNRFALPDKDRGEIVWTLAVFHILRPNDFVRQAAIAFLDDVDDISPSMAAAGQFFQAAQYFDYSRDRFVRLAQPGMTSRTEKDFLYDLKMAAPQDVSVKAGKVRDKMEYTPDIVMTGRGKTLMVEIDGPKHYRNGRFTGGTLMMTALMQRAYPDEGIVRVHWKLREKWDALDEDGTTPDARAQAISAFIGQVVALPAAAYECDANGVIKPMFKRFGEGQMRYAYTPRLAFQTGERPDAPASALTLAPV